MGVNTKISALHEQIKYATRWKHIEKSELFNQSVTYYTNYSLWACPIHRFMEYSKM